jgi:TonB family protein
MKFLSIVAACVLVIRLPLPGTAQQPKTVLKNNDELMAKIATWVEPKYPPIARAARAGGPVMVEIEIDTQGTVTAARAVAGHPLLQAVTVQAARQWKFQPFTEGGAAVRVIGRVAYNFPETSVTEDGKTLEQLEVAVRRRPRSARSHYALGQAYFRALRYEDAVAQLLIATKLNPKYLDALLKLGYSYMRLHELDNALIAFTDAARIDPKRSEPLHAQGVTRALLGQYEKAIIDFQRSLELDEPIQSSYFFIGKCYVMLGRHDEAISYYQQGLANWNNSEGHFGLGEAYFEANRFEEAIGEFRKSLELSYGPGKSSTHYLLGRSYLRVDDTQAALKEYEVLKQSSESLAKLLLEEIKTKVKEKGRSKG